MSNLDFSSDRPAAPTAAAFMLIRSPEGRVLLLRRAKGEDHAGEWSLPGGKLKSGEDAETAPARETVEETGYHVGRVKWHCRRVKDNCDAVTFLFDCDAEFAPRLNSEHDAWQWVDPVEALEMSA
jgi:8-oxo-dGTP diphosphatase